MERAFPAHVIELMPPMSEIPQDIDPKWYELQRDWFFFGLSSLVFKVRPGIDRDAALSTLTAIQGSFEPKHEHKEAAVAYLMSLWFVDATWERARA